MGMLVGARLHERNRKIGVSPPISMSLIQILYHSYQIIFNYGDNPRIDAPQKPRREPMVENIDGRFWLQYLDILSWI